MLISRSSNAPSQGLRKHRLKAPSPPVRDRFESRTELQAPLDPRVAGTPKPTSKPGWRLAGKALLTGLAASSALLGANASAQVAAPEMVEILTQSKIQRAMTEPQFQELFEGLPKDFFQLMSGLSDTQIKVLGGGINGKTTVGPVTVNNRKAFIKGRVFGRDVWPYVHNSVSRISARDALSQEHTDELHQAVDQMRELSKTQRQGLAEAMDAINSY